MKISKYLLTGILFLLAFNLFAQIPETISFQGILKDNNGDVVADASYTMEFELYDALTIGTKVWGPESHAVNTTDGIYSVSLGGNGVAISNSTDFKTGYFLQIKVNGEILAPRIALTVSPYAFIARSVQGTDNIMPSSGNVGIGTTTPTTELEVAGSVTATEFVGGGAGLTGLSSSPWTGTADLSYSAGNVGIGTATPGSLFEVSGDPGIVEITGINGNPELIFTEGIDKRWQIGYDVTGNNLFFTESGLGDRLVLAQGGNVGIGTIAPTTELDVAGTVTATEFVGGGSGLTGLPSSPWTGTPDISYSSGNVGIGTSAPEKLLHVEGDNTNADMVLREYSGSPNFNLQRSGGTKATPSAVLSNDILGIVTFKGYDGVGFDLGSSIKGRASENWTSTARGSSIEFKTTENGTTSFLDRMIITNEGNVGIGTMTPSTQLDVNGTVTATSFIGDGSGLTSFPSKWLGSGIIIYNSGMVGVGTTTEVEVTGALTVKGDVGQGIVVENSHSGSSNKYSMHLDNTTDGANRKYGIYNTVRGFSSTNGLDNYGLYNNMIASLTTGNVYGNYNLLWDNGTGGRIGTYSSVSANSSNGSSIKGSDVQVSHEGSGASYAYSAGVGGNGSGDKYGYRANFTGSGSGINYGLYLTGEDINYLSGNVGIGTDVPTSELEVNGYTKLGSDAPAIKMKKFTGTIPSFEGFDLGVTHNLDQSKILSVKVMVDKDPGAGKTFVPESYTLETESEFSWYLTSAQVRIIGGISSSGNLINQEYRILITYEQ